MTGTWQAYRKKISIRKIYKINFYYVSYYSIYVDEYYILNRIYYYYHFLCVCYNVYILYCFRMRKAAACFDKEISIYYLRPQQRKLISLWFISKANCNFYIYSLEDFRTCSWGEIQKITYFNLYIFFFFLIECPCIINSIILRRKDTTEKNNTQIWNFNNTHTHFRVYRDISYFSCTEKKTYFKHYDIFVSFNEFFFFKGPSRTHNSFRFFKQTKHDVLLVRTKLLYSQFLK